MPLSSIMVLLAAAAIGAPASPASPSKPAAPPATASLQAQFDAATQAAQADECDKAIGLFRALRASGKLKSGSIAEAAAGLREGHCLIRTGDEAAGETMIVAGLPRLAAKPADFGAELAQAYSDVGIVAFHRLDYALAGSRYRQALSLAPAEDRSPVLAMLARVTAFDPGPEALAFADEGIRLATEKGKPGRQTQATFRTLRARILLNRGSTQEAFDELKRALALSGGLGLNSVSLSEVSMRGDLATAALLLGRKDDARNYLAYTGQGRLKEGPFKSAQAMFAPDCGAVSGLMPQDFAIVEFSIGDDGAVANATPVYTRGGPRVAAAFGQIVRRWSWAPEQAKAISPFYRTATRVELRCSNAGGPGRNRRGPLLQRFSEWALPQVAVRTEDVLTSPEAFAALRTKLTASRVADDAAGIAAAAGLLGLGESTSQSEAAQMYDLALATGAKPGAVPTEVRNALLVFRASIRPEVRTREGRYFGPQDRTAIRALLQTPTIEADPVAAATLRLMLASGNRRDPAPADADALLAAVADADRLTMRHPLRQIAQLELADHAAQRGDLATAQAWFAKTGLTEEQCALVGTMPAMTRSGVNSSQYPDEALAYGFEGFIKLEFDVSANGRAVAPRTIIAYPPFVFSDSAKIMASGMRFETSYRPAQSKACSARNETINFVIPQNH